MIFFNSKYIINLLFVFLFDVYVFHDFNEWSKTRYIRILNEKAKKYEPYFTFSQKRGANRTFKYNLFFIDNWERKKNKKSFIVRKHKLCSIFSILKKKSNKKEVEKDKNKIIVNALKSVRPKNDNIGSNTVYDNKKNDNSDAGLDKSKEDLGCSSSLESKKLTSTNKKDNSDAKSGNSSDKSGHEQILTIFEGINLNSFKTFKNANEYQKHLERLKEKVTFSLNKILCSYAKSFNKNNNFKCFFENLLKILEKNYHKYSLIEYIEKLKNEQTKKDYILINLNCFIEILNVIESHLFNTLVLNTQFLKINAINEIKDVSANKKSSSNYITYSNSINQIIEKYEKQFKKLYLENYEFSLYNNIMKNNELLMQFTYRFPINKYKEHIDTNIEYLKKFYHYLSKKKKKKIYNEMERNKNYQNVLQIIDNQQKQIEVLQEQLESSIERMNGKHTPFHCAVAYRIPDTNLNISTQCAKGKLNINLNCIPDDSSHLLGTYGFVKSLPFGNLGLSLSMNF